MATKIKSVKKPKPEVRKQVEEKVKKEITDKVIIENILEDTENIFVSQDNKYCPVCGNILSSDNFEKTRSQLYKDGKLHICNGCLRELIDKYYNIYKDLRDVLVILCSITNTMVVKEALDDTIKEYGNSKTKRKDAFSYYLKALDKYIIDYNTWNNTYLSFESSNFGGKPFRKCCMDDSLTKIHEIEAIVGDSDNEDLDEEIVLTPIQRKKLFKKWGDKEDEDLIWLDQREKSYYDTHDIPNDHINKSGVITLCNLELQEFKTLCEGGDVKKILESKSRVLSTVSFSPKKKAKEDETSNAIDLGSLIKRREDYSPVINNDPELDDIDKIQNISKALAGALCRTAKIESPVVEEFEKIMKDYTFEFASTGDDDE